MHNLAPLWRWYLVVAILSLCVVGRPSVARAAPDAGTSVPNAEAGAAPVGAPRPLLETLTGAAKLEYEAGLTLVAANDFGGAFTKFKVAYEKSSDPRLLWNMAATQKMLHRYAAAQDLLRRYVTEAGGVLTVNERLEAEQLVRAFDAFTATLRLTAQPPGAVLVVDGHVVAKVPTRNPIVLDLGSHHLRVSKDGFVPYESDVSIEAHEELAADIHLASKTEQWPACARSTASWAPAGQLVVVARSIATISLDEEPVGRGRADCTVLAGSHTVSVGAPGYSTYRKEIVIAPQSVLKVEPPIAESALSVLAEPGMPAPSSVETKERPGGCGCRTLGLSSGAPSAVDLVLLVAAALSIVLRRRRSRTAEGA